MLLTDFIFNYFPFIADPNVLCHYLRKLEAMSVTIIIAIYGQSFIVVAAIESSWK